MTAETDSEESTVQLTLGETYDNIRNGAHLIVSYDAATNSFKGTVKNTTNGTLTQVRVEVHLSNGVELGPTTPLTLPPVNKYRLSSWQKVQPLTCGQHIPKSVPAVGAAVKSVVSMAKVAVIIDHSPVQMPL